MRLLIVYLLFISTTQTVAYAELRPRYQIFTDIIVNDEFIGKPMIALRNKQTGTITIKGKDKEAKVEIKFIDIKYPQSPYPMIRHSAQILFKINIKYKNGKIHNFVDDLLILQNQWHEYVIKKILKLYLNLKH